MRKIESSTKNGVFRKKATNAELEGYKAGNDGGQIYYDTVIKMPNVSEENLSGGCCGLWTKSAKNRIDRRQETLARMEEYGLSLRKEYTSDKSYLLVSIGADVTQLEAWAERYEVKIKLTPENGSRFIPFDRAHKESYSEHQPGMVFTSSERQRIITRIFNAPKITGGLGLQIGKLTRKRIITQFTYLHNEEEREELNKTWVKKPFSEQPIDAIVEYFGETIAFYFAWLGFYTQLLVLPSILGLVLTWWMYYVGIYSAQGSEEASGSQIFLFWSVFISIWSTVLGEFWKRYEKGLAYRFDVLNYTRTAHHRSEFRGAIRQSPVTDKPEVYYSKYRRWIKYAISGLIVFALISASVTLMIVLVADRITSTRSTFDQFSISIIYSLFLVIAEQVFTRIALALNNWENHQFDQDYQNQLIIKTFAFQLVNSFVALYFYAFYSPWNGEKDPNVIQNLSIQLFTTMLIRSVVGNIKEYLQPLIMKRLGYCLARRKKAKALRSPTGSESGEHLGKEDIESPKAVKGKVTLTLIEKETSLPAFGTTFNEYAELMLQFGFVTFFSTTFPAAAAIALVNNIVEIRSDASKLLFEIARPLSSSASSIGAWQRVLEGMSVIAIATNALLLSFSTGQARRLVNQFYYQVPDTQDIGNFEKLVVAVLFEHALILLKFGLSTLIPDVPENVQIKIDRDEYKKKVLVGKAVDYEDIEHAQDPDSEDDEMLIFQDAINNALNVGN